MMMDKIKASINDDNTEYQKKKEDGSSQTNPDFFKDFLLPGAGTVVGSMIILWLSGGEYKFLMLSVMSILLIYFFVKWNSKDREKRRDGYILPVIAIAFVLLVALAYFVKTRQVYDTTSTGTGNGTKAPIESNNETVTTAEPSNDNISVVNVLKIGDRNFEFGVYGLEKIGGGKLKWRVLDVVDGKALLITEKLIDCKPYNEESVSVTWKECSLRAWLNEDFFNFAFNEEEKGKIILSKIENPDNPVFGTDGGEDTEDRIFLLSIPEAYRYFSDSDRSDSMATPTEYAISHGANTSPDYKMDSGEETGWWWLRSPGQYGYSAADVRTSGYVSRVGFEVNNSGSSVRPALWIKLES